MVVSQWSALPLCTLGQTFPNAVSCPDWDAWITQRHSLRAVQHLAPRYTNTSILGAVVRVSGVRPKQINAETQGWPLSKILLSVRGRLGIWLGICVSRATPNPCWFSGSEPAVFGAVPCRALPPGVSASRIAVCVFSHGTLTGKAQVLQAEVS